MEKPKPVSETHYPNGVERPQVKLIGSMNDLLAGTGSKETDDHVDCNGGPLSPCDIG